MTTRRRTLPLLVIVALFALLVTGCVSEPGDTFTQTLQIGGALVLCYCGVMIGRAIAARLAGDKYEEVLTPAILSISIALPRRENESSQKEHGSTEDTSTPKYTEVHESTPQSTLESTPDTLKLTGAGGDQVILTTRITDEEHAEFETCRRDAIVLLNKCVQYYRETGEVDTGKIPRHSDLHMGEKNRKKAVNDLWDSGYCSKGPEGTFIHPEVADSCRELLNGIITRNPKYKVYPLGYSKRKQKLMDSAVMALPENERHD